jgi:hypothetical protein
MDAPGRGNERQEDGRMEVEKMFKAIAFVGERAEPRAQVDEVTIIAREDGRMLFENEHGTRQWTHPFITCESMHLTREAAELWCAGRLEAEAAPTLKLIAQLREQAAARVAQREVVSV